jgi:hypothetical protein
MEDLPVRRLMFLLSLIAALTGTMLRQAEAADDLARGLGQLASGNLVEESDGRVGDDSGETIKGETGRVSMAISVAAALTAPSSLLDRPVQLVSPLRLQAARHFRGPRSQLCTLLQRFLF